MFFLMIRRPPRSPLFPYTRSSDLPCTDGVPCRTTAAAAPWAFAWSRNACASKRSPWSATNRAPGVRCRVSVATPPGKRRPRGPDTPKARLTRSESQTVTAPPRMRIADCGLRIGSGSVVRRATLHCHSAIRNPQSAIVSRRPQFFDDHPLIERNLFGADDLVRLVPLAGEQQRVSGARQLETEGDGPAAIDLAVVGLRSHRRLHGVEDFLGILGARVVRRGDGDVGEARAHLAHGRALARVAG